VGVDAFGQPGWLTDGMNERGVYAGLLYMPGFCDYPAADGRDPATCMSIVNAIGLSKMTISPSRHSMTAEAPPASCSMRCEEGAFPKPLTVHGHTVTADMSDPRAWFDF
jgi:hypothetical protein